MSNQGHIVNLAKQGYCIQFVCLCVCVCVCVCVSVSVCPWSAIYIHTTQYKEHYDIIS